MVYSLSFFAFTVIGVLFQWILKFFCRSKESVPEKLINQDATHKAPYPCNAIKGNQKFRITMGLRRLDERNWLTVDRNYSREHDIRKSLLEERRNEVIQCLPESKDACVEALEVVAEFLCERYPDMFVMEKRSRKKRVHNRKTGETFVVGDDKESIDPLEIAVRLAMEDLSILMKNEEGEYYVYVKQWNPFRIKTKTTNNWISAASATLFPVGWTVQNRIGWTISQMHDPVPEWKSKIGHSVNKSVFCHSWAISGIERELTE